MDVSMLAEIIGWCAGICAAASYAFKEVKTVRKINCAAAALFIIYSVLIGAPSVALMNASLVAIHLAYLASNGKFGDFVATHGKAVICAFSVYALVSVITVTALTSENGSANWAEILGSVSSVMFVGGFLLPDERALRGVCSIALVANIAYAIAISSLQVVLTNLIGLAANLFYLLRKRKAGVAAIKNNEPAEER